MTFNSWVPDGDGSYLLTLDGQVYCTEAVLNTAYLFTHRAHITVETNDDSCIVARIFLSDSDSNIKDITQDFLRELVDQQLRASIWKETAELKKAIITEAFAPLEDICRNEPS